MHLAPRSCVDRSAGPAIAAASPQARAIDAFFPSFGNNGYDVQHYALDLDVTAAQHRIGPCPATVRATARLASFALDLRGLTVDAVWLERLAGTVRPGRRQAAHPARGTDRPGQPVHGRDRLSRPPVRHRRPDLGLMARRSRSSAG